MATPPRPPTFVGDEIPAESSFPEPLVGGASMANDLAMADVDNYAPPKDETGNIKCLTCRHFFHRKHLALSWSTRAAGNRRLEGRGTCLFTSPPTELIGEYVTYCNKYTQDESATPAQENT